MKERSISSIILFALLFLVLYIGKNAFIPLAILANIFCLVEYLRIIGTDNKGIAFMCVLSLVLIGFSMFLSEYMLSVFAVIVVLIFILNIVFGQTNADKAIYQVFAMTYISLFISFAIRVILGVENGIYLVYLIMAIPIASDCFAYLIGMRFGKHRLSPIISPKKSIEGSIAGEVFAIIAAIILYFVYTKFELLDIGFYHYVILGIICSVVGQFGDLTASMVKRRFKIKDFSHIIPGHGGVLDRIDSMLFSAAVAYMYIDIVLKLI